MKFAIRPLAVGLALSLLCIAAAPAAHAAETAVFGEATEKLETYYLRLYDSWGRPKARENDLAKAQPRAEKKAIEAAKKKFEEVCRNSKNGEPSRVVAFPAAAPGESSACAVSWNEDKGKGTVTCSAKARGVCTVRGERLSDPKISTNVTSPVREVTVDGRHYLIDENGVAHPIAGAARD